LHGSGRRVAVAARPTARADRRLTRPARSAATALLAILWTAGALSGELSTAEVEEAAETGRRAAAALLRGNRSDFEAILDTEAIGKRLLSGDVWRRLSDRQRRRFESIVRTRFADALAPPPGSAAEIAWSSARPEGDTVAVFLGLRYPAGLLKTRSTIARRGTAWAITDVILTDPGISLAAEAGRAWGEGAVHRRDRAREARAAAFPRALGIAAIAIIVLVVSRRLEPTGRKILLLAAAAPAILFAVDGVLAVRRVLSEPYRVPEVATPSAWAASERQALAAQREGRLEDAQRLWTTAVAAGAPPAPADYQLGLALKAAGRTAEAREAFTRALSRSAAAPGASKELGLLALAEGKSREAGDLLRRYLEAAGPDPDTLSALAVALANTGEEAAAVASVEQARALMAERWNGVRLQAQIYARAGDAASTVETLRALEPGGTIDRESLRADPAYLPIATDPAWIAFLAETPAPTATPGRASPPSRP
jgi:tetratricopeptide (TPR) repeat protein